MATLLRRLVRPASYLAHSRLNVFHSMHLVKLSALMHSYRKMSASRDQSNEITDLKIEEWTQVGLTLLTFTLPYFKIDNNRNSEHEALYTITFFVCAVVIVIFVIHT